MIRTKNSDFSVCKPNTLWSLIYTLAFTPELNIGLHVSIRSTWKVYKRIMYIQKYHVCRYSYMDNLENLASYFRGKTHVSTNFT